jgi:hypothetical protein
MAIAAVVQLVVGVTLVVLRREDRDWSPLGLILVLFGFLFAQLGTTTVALQYASWAVMALSVLLVATTIPRTVWAVSRLQLVLAGATVLGIWLTYFGQSLSKERLILLVVLTGTIAAWFVVMVVRAVKLNRATPERPTV